MQIIYKLKKFFTKLISSMRTVNLNCVNGGNISIDATNITAIYISGIMTDIFLNVAPYKVTVIVDDNFLLLLKKYKHHYQKQSFTLNHNFGSI